ncbi:hypothetical protein ACROYT_G014516 [Oculina patagonica]
MEQPAVQRLMLLSNFISVICFYFDDESQQSSAAYMYSFIIHIHNNSIVNISFVNIIVSIVSINYIIISINYINLSIVSIIFSINYIIYISIILVGVICINITYFYIIQFQLTPIFDSTPTFHIIWTTCNIASSSSLNLVLANGSHTIIFPASFIIFKPVISNYSQPSVVSSTALQTFYPASAVPALQLSAPPVSSFSYHQLSPASSSLVVDPETLGIHAKYALPGQSCFDRLNSLSIPRNVDSLKQVKEIWELGLPTLKRLDGDDEEFEIDQTKFPSFTVHGQISNEQLLCTAPSSSSSSPPEPLSNNASGAVQAFEALEAVLSTPSRAKYRRRMDGNYDLEGSPTFSAWKKLYSAKEDLIASGTVELQGATAERSNVGSSSTGATAEQSSVESSSTGATAEQSSVESFSTGATEEPSSRVASSLTVAPTTSETPSTGVQINSSMTRPRILPILLDEKLKKARQLAEKQKKLQEREKKKEERRKKLEEEKLRKEQRKKERADRKKKDQGNPGSKRTRKSKSRSQGGRGKTWRQSAGQSHDDENVCSICFPQMARITLGSSATAVNCGCT